MPKLSEKGDLLGTWVFMQKKLVIFRIKRDYLIIKWDSDHRISIFGIPTELRFEWYINVYINIALQRENRKFTAFLQKRLAIFRIKHEYLLIT
jgi:hypothetical protein